MLAAQPDTLQAVTVVADRGVVVSRTDTVLIKSGLDVSGTLLQLPGLSVGDYGGAAGNKSVSLRGFGAAHTAIYLDGVRVGNVQSGQLDLGMLGMGSLGAVVADYAQNSISFRTARPVFHDSPVAGTVRLQGGSFGTWKPYGRLDFRLGERWSLSAHAAGIISKGDFPLEDGSFRANNDIKQIQAGTDVFGTLQGGDFHGKVYFNGSHRGTPGSVSYPSATDRQKDRNLLAQAVYHKAFNSLYALHLSAKASYDDLMYFSEWGDSRYKQTELQLNTAHKFTLQPWWTVSVAADLSWDGLKSDMYNESRLGTVAALASAFRTSRFKADLAVEYAGVFDKSGPKWNSVSPSADLRFTVVDGFDVVAFGRRAFRTPTFNDLYYPGSGNTELKPEDAWLADLGLDFAHRWSAWMVKARVDAYYNYLTNKITWAPADDTGMIWLPFNVGKVQAKGVDVLLGADYAAEDWKAGASVRYGFQKAVDKTPDSYTFDQQLAYVPIHTLVLTANVGWKGWSLEGLYHLRAGRTDGAGTKLDWNTLDCTLGKTICLGKAGSLALQAKGCNLLNRRFELNSGYPMPGRSFLAGIEYKF